MIEKIYNKLMLDSETRKIKLSTFKTYYHKFNKDESALREFLSSKREEKRKGKKKCNTEQVQKFFYNNKKDFNLTAQQFKISVRSVYRYITN